MSIYKTRRQQKRDKTLKKIRNVILITVLLSSAVAIAFYYISRKTKNVAGIIAQPVKKDTVPVKEAMRPQPKKSLTTPPVIVENLPADTAKKASPQGKEQETKIAHDTANLKEVRKLPAKQLSPEKMREIVDDIATQKSEMNNVANCVTIRKTSSSNVDNVFEIADLLKTKGFVISGRQTINQNIEGIVIDASGSCITLTVGNL